MIPEIDFAKLREEIPYKWRVQSFSKFKPSASCVAYVDARDVMDLLDLAVGPDRWQDDYKVVDGSLMAGIGIKCDNGWVWKWDTGVESQVEKEKGQVSDAFKRAAVHWGIGRFLYRLSIVNLPANEKKENGNYPYPVDGSGKRIWDVTKHINDMHGIKTPARPDVPKISVAMFEKGIDFFAEKQKTIADLDKWFAEKKPSYNILSDTGKAKVDGFLKDTKADMKEANESKPTTVLCPQFASLVPRIDCQECELVKTCEAYNKGADNG
ncbi:MAG: hypothetical protein KJ630_19265 [Proteobacteria bacterium]|nr:hypothetical protein [Pseudomonadota bacterium]